MNFPLLEFFKRKTCHVSGYIISQSLLFGFFTVLRCIAVSTMSHATQHAGRILTYLDNLIYAGLKVRVHVEYTQEPLHPAHTF